MKVLIFSNIPAPYFVEYVKELANYCDVHVVFECKKASNRDKSWGKNDFENIKVDFLGGIPIASESSFSLMIKKILKQKRIE